MKTIDEYLEEQINEQLCQAILSGSRGDGPSKVKIRPVEIRGQSSRLQDCLPELIILVYAYDSSFFTLMEAPSPNGRMEVSSSGLCFSS